MESVKLRRVKRIPPIRGSTSFCGDNSISQLDCRKFFATTFFRLGEIRLWSQAFVNKKRRMARIFQSSSSFQKIRQDSPNERRTTALFLVGEDLQCRENRPNQQSAKALYNSFKSSDQSLDERSLNSLAYFRAMELCAITA